MLNFRAKASSLRNLDGHGGRGLKIRNLCKSKFFQTSFCSNRIVTLRKFLKPRGSYCTCFMFQSGLGFVLLLLRCRKILNSAHHVYSRLRANKAISKNYPLPQGFRGCYCNFATKKDSHALIWRSAIVR